MNLQHQRKLLTDLRAQYEAGLSDVKEQRRSGLRRYESTEVPDDDVDAGTVLFDRERNEVIEEDFAALLKQVERALAKIDEGTYGLCDNCRKPIPEERLKALPYATLGIDCQERLERSA
ncbi:MAG: TraR/DksA C4-type zinc finger protein [Capsulimonadaceae bacterium]|nr:TraR/DksA C4-type zinc finger protein [Capsulimonadaceae bacterium]